MVGTELGNYRIVDALGKGGMGHVYLAEHRLLGRTAAIKVLDERFDDDETIKTRFFNEARAISALKHPSIVEVYDFGYAPDGRAYLVMELLSGEPLGRRMRRGALPIGHTIVFARQIASALALAHQHGVVHRDLKPDNVFLERDPEVDVGERAKVLDFGVAKRPRGDYDEAALTKTGVLLGTPAYMSPEQVDGREITARSDIYSLGIVVYRMLTGRLPWVVDDQAELLQLHLAAPVPPPSEFAPDIPPPLQDLVMRCLAKRPDDRIASMDDVAAELAALARMPTDAPLTPRPEALSRPLPLPAPEITATHAPAPPPDFDPDPDFDAELDPIDSPTTLRGSAGEASGPFALPAPRRWLGFVAAAAIALATLGILAWVLRAPAATTSTGAAAPAPAVDARDAGVTAPASPPDASPPDGAPTDAPPPDAPPRRAVESQRDNARAKPAPRPAPRTTPDSSKRRDFEKPVF